MGIRTPYNGRSLPDLLCRIRLQRKYISLFLLCSLARFFNFFAFIEDRYCIFAFSFSLEYQTSFPRSFSSSDFPAESFLPAGSFVFSFRSFSFLFLSCLSLRSISVRDADWDVTKAASPHTKAPVPKKWAQGSHNPKQDRGKSHDKDRPQKYSGFGASMKHGINDPVHHLRRRPPSYFHKSPDNEAACHSVPDCFPPPEQYHINNQLLRLQFI